MYKKLMVLIISLIVAGNCILTAQNPAPAKKDLPPVDTLKNKEGMRLVMKVMANDHSDPLFNQVCVFGNPECQHCEDLLAALRKKNIKFTSFDLRDNKLMLKMHDMIVEKEQSGKVAYSFPLVLYKGELYYNFKDQNVFVEELYKKLNP